MTGTPAVEDPRPALGAPSEELVELVQLLRRDLARRREAPRGDWVEEIAADLRAGRRAGWYYPVSTGGAVAFYSAHGTEGFGHVHVVEGAEAEERGRRLLGTMLDALPPSLRSLDVGFTGLDPAAEHHLLEPFAARAGSTVIERQMMVHELTAENGVAVPDLAAPLRQVPVADVTPEALAELDQRAFAGTVDELLVGPGLEEHRRVVEAILEGSLGRFLPEASAALVGEAPTRLVGALLTAEQSPHRAVFLNFLVDPAERGRGYGRYLLRWGLRALRALGYSEVHLWVTLANRSALRLYEAHGFRVVASATIYRWERSGSDPPQPHSER